MLSNIEALPGEAFVPRAGNGIPPFPAFLHGHPLPDAGMQEYAGIRRQLQPFLQGATNEISPGVGSSSIGEVAEFVEFGSSWSEFSRIRLLPGYLVTPSEWENRLSSTLHPDEPRFVPTETASRAA